MDRDKKRELRQLKREIKRAGGKHRRTQLKRGLAEHPEAAHEDTPSVGRHRSADLNGIDRDSSRKRETPDPRSEISDLGSEETGLTSS